MREIRVGRGVCKAPEIQYQLLAAGALEKKLTVKGCARFSSIDLSPAFGRGAALNWSFSRSPSTFGVERFEDEICWNDSLWGVPRLVRHDIGHCAPKEQ